MPQSWAQCQPLGRHPMHISSCVIELPQLCPKVRDGSWIVAGEAGRGLLGCLCCVFS